MNKEIERLKKVLNEAGIDVKITTEGTRWKRKERDWIRVKDGLPEPDRMVLVYNKSSKTRGEILVAEYWDDMKEWSTIDNYSALDNITHWMPLPQPPEE